MILPMFIPTGSGPEIKTCGDAVSAFIGGILALAVLWGVSMTILHWDDLTEIYAEVTMTDQERFQRSVDARLAEIADEEWDKKMRDSITRLVESQIEMQQRRIEQFQQLSEENKLLILYLNSR